MGVQRGFVAMQKGVGWLQRQQENADEPAPESDVPGHTHNGLDTEFHRRFSWRQRIFAWKALIWAAVLDSFAISCYSIEKTAQDCRER